MSMNGDQFLATIGIAILCGAAAVPLKHLIWGEVFGLLALAWTAVAIIGYWLWPLTPSSGLLGAGVILVVGFSALALDYALAQERRRFEPNFQIEIIRIFFVNSRVRPVQRDAWLFVRVHNNGGTPSSIRHWRVNISFWPNVGFLLQDGRVLSAWGPSTIDDSRTPDGQPDLRSNSSVISSLGHIQGWIGLGIMDAPVMSVDETQAFAGIKSIRLSCCSQTGRWFHSETMPRDGWQDNNSTL